jgi:hypothetical protein
MLGATQRKLREAQFFYRHLLDVQQGKRNEPEAFSFFFSAFIQAARNVTWVMGSEGKNKYDVWKPLWERELTEEEKKLEKLTNELRLDETKRRGAEIIVEPEEVETYELLRNFEIQMGRPAYLMEAQPGSIVTPKFYRPAHYLETEDGKAKVTEICKRYLDFLEKKVAAFQVALANWMTKKYPRGTAFHEAGHAVVAWSLGLDVKDIHVSDDDASGGAQIECAARLPFIEQLAVCMAGYAAERVFECPAHEHAAAGDRARVLELLKGIPEDQGKALRDEGHNCARHHLESHKNEVVKLAERLVECGYVDAREFMRLMHGQTT